MLVVDWKNMNPVKISNISELQIHDLIQFKVSIYMIIKNEVKNICILCLIVDIIHE